ncbi:NlpC/P60 family protein [Mycobacteroides salmoniphilum]|uniref:Peptidoglycan endopeptidase RipB n=2 Tax=Mycobacteroides salmoniphilum TaxID=404941 RepID=A0A4R8SU27_9MYCO|nr:NlpC/P60 family protein [Mycobacteroides salmoniphilum]TDZ93368.1 Peptidoglycan endopeptidase RipB precursor [Mycobacteroides salmoniphilum]TEA03985.1 Peptidoglycan endopeptidase RipB precursor [Mycobacteroides salmoniphilum]
MVSAAELDKWDPNALVQLLGVMFRKHKRLANLGDTLDGIKRSLEGWGGEAADTWRQELGKRRTDIDEQQKQTRAVTDALEPVVDEVGRIVNDYRALKGEIAKFGWQITPDGKVVGDVHGDLMLETVRGNKESELKRILERATAIDDDIAAAIRRSVAPTDTPTDPKEQPDKSDPTILASAPVGGADGNPPYPNGAKPTMIPGATVPMADNPPGWDQNLPAGPQRDQAWKDYLAGKNADGTQRPPGSAPLALPKPEAVSDKGLRVIGAAGRQQGVSYAWGGNHSTEGPSQGTLAGDPPDGGAHQYRDDQRIGFDCGGLVRYSTQQGAGYDVFQRADGLDAGAGTDRIDKSQHLAPVGGGARIPSGRISSIAQPGDILVFEIPASGHEAFSGNNTQHTGIYVGNGYMINAPSSGKPVRLDNADDDGRMTDVLRLKP